MSGPPASGIVAAGLVLSLAERRMRVLARVMEMLPGLADPRDVVQGEEQVLKGIIFDAGVHRPEGNDYVNWRVDASLWMKSGGKIEEFPEARSIVDYPIQIITANNSRHGTRQQIWELLCGGLEPFAGCEPFEIPLTATQKKTYATNVSIVFSNARFFSVDLQAREEKEASHQWRLSVWFNNTADPGQYKDLSQLQEAWRVLSSWYKAICQGRGVHLYQYITEYRQAQMEDRRKLMLGGPDSAIEHNRHTDIVPATGPASYTDATTATEEPDEEPRASLGELGVIKEEVARICAGIAFNDTMPELRRFALRNPRALRLSPQAILYHAVKAWRDGCTERIDAILQGMIL